MLSALKFVRGAVSKKDFQPALTHFLIKEGRVTGFDGIIALSSPIDLDIEAAPKALPFVKAIERCTSQTTSLNLTATGKITIRSGSFRAIVECTDEHAVLSEIKPEGTDVKVSGNLLKALHTLEPFISTDASRSWAMGILLRGFSAYATNNIIVGQYWLGEQMPDINLPASAIKELTRINEEPHRIQLSENSATFHFEDGRWLRTQLLASDWADIDYILDTAFEGADLQPVHEGLFDALDVLEPFLEAEGRVLFRENLITTSLEGAVGASVDIEGLPDHGAYNHSMMGLLKDSVEKIDFSKHPRPCPFVGEKLRGVFLGMIEP